MLNALFEHEQHRHHHQSHMVMPSLPATRLVMIQPGLAFPVLKRSLDPHNGEITVAPTAKHYPPDTAAAFIWLKNRQRDKWNDRKEHTGPSGKPLIPEEQTDLETVRRAAFVLAQALHQQDDDCDH